MKDTVGGNDWPARESGVAPLKVRHTPTGFADQEDPGGQIPRVEIELPETIKASARLGKPTPRPRNDGADAVDGDNDNADDDAVKYAE